MEDITKAVELVSEIVTAASALMFLVNRMLSNAPPQWRPWTDAISRVLNAISLNSARAHDKEDKPK